MRIAIVGTHAVGKSTLAADLGKALSGYRVVEEAYWQLDGEGYVFADVPSPEDFEAQLERSLRCVREEQGRVIFDRSPADYLAYLLADRDADQVLRKGLGEDGWGLGVEVLRVYGTPGERVQQVMARVAGAQGGQRGSKR